MLKMCVALSVWRCVGASIISMMVFGALATSAQAQRMPAMGPSELDSFLVRVMSSPGYSGARLSPSGRYLLYVDEGLHATSEDDVFLYDLDIPGDSGRRRIDVGNHRVNWVDWASEDQFLISISSLRTTVLNFGTRRNPEQMVVMSLPSRVLSIDRATLTRSAVLFEDSPDDDYRNRDLSEITDMLPDDPDHVLMPGYSRRNYNLYRVNLHTGEAEKIENGTRNTIAWFTVNGAAVMKIESSPGRRQSLRFYARTGRRGGWRRLTNIRMRDLFGLRADFEWAGPSDVAGEIFVRARPDDQNFFGIYRYDLAEGVYLHPVAQREDFDIEEGIIDNLTGQYLGYSYHSDRLEFQFHDPELQSHYEAIESFFDGDISVIPTAIGGDRILFFASGPTEPGAYYIYDLVASSIDPVLRTHPSLRGDSLRPSRPIQYEARDGLLISGYLTEPLSGADATTPLIVYPHGGPEVRDSMNFDPVVQYLAALGYSVFQPNYRGSAGYGRAFAESGYRQWGRAMQDDITDGVRWLASEGLADPEAVCIVGFSYGGYAALMGAALTPDTYKCAVAGGSVTDFEGFLDFKDDEDEQVQTYWEELLGNRRQDRDEIAAYSPVNVADQISVPVFLFHGDADEIVPVEQSRDLARAMESAGTQYLYLEDAGVGHNWGTYRRFYENMRNIGAFLNDAMDGSLDTFNLDTPDEEE
jgi:dienelactone hydrolase